MSQKSGIINRLLIPVFKACDRFIALFNTVYSTIQHLATPSLMQASFKILTMMTVWCGTTCGSNRWREDLWIGLGRRKCDTCIYSEKNKQTQNICTLILLSIKKNARVKKNAHIYCPIVFWVFFLNVNVSS
jgi:hypothetical protein